MTVAQILSQSSNVGTITLAQMLGRSRVESWIGRFGFGEGTGVDAPGEAEGLLPSYWSGSSIGNVPIGQGIGVTPIQMAAAYGAIANDGVYRKPYLVERVGKEWRSRGPGRRVLSRTVSAQMMAMLRDVVSAEGGTGAAAAVPGYTVAGKTGTAAKPVPGLLDLALRGLVRRRRPREGAAARRPRLDRRAAGGDLGRRRRRARLRRHRALEPRRLEVAPDSSRRMLGIRRSGSSA